MFREKSPIKKWFISSKIELKDSPIHGIGVFAKERIPKLEVIESAPVVLAHVDTMHTLNSFCGDGARHIFMDYVFSFGPGKIAFPLGWSGIYNHAFEPNAFWDVVSEDVLPGRGRLADHPTGYNALVFRTKVDIEVGEEICTRYQATDKLWFVDDDAPDSHFDPYEGSLTRPSFAYSRLSADIGKVGEVLKKDDETLAEFSGKKKL